MLSFLRARGKSEHKRIQEQLSAYLDGELSARDQAAVEQHLRTCGQCARDLATLRWTVNLVREVPAMALPRSFTVRVAAVAPARVARRTGLAYAYLRGATALAAVLLALVLSGDVLSQFFATPLLTPQVIEKEVAVEKLVVQTVVVEKEVVVEKPVVETVVVEAEKVVEKASVKQGAKAITPPAAERAIAAQTKATGERVAPEAQPTASPAFQAAERILATKGAEKPQEAGVGAELRGTPTPPAPAEAPTEATPLPTEAPPGAPTAAAAEESKGLAAAVTTPTGAPGEAALELPKPSPEPSPAERQILSVSSGRGLSPLRWLEIGLLAAVIVLGVATLIARRGL